MVVGASYDQGSSRAQLHLRQILDARLMQFVFGNNEFLFRKKLKKRLMKNGNLKDEEQLDTYVLV